MSVILLSTTVDSNLETVVSIKSGFFETFVESVVFVFVSSLVLVFVSSIFDFSKFSILFSTIFSFDLISTSVLSSLFVLLLIFSLTCVSYAVVDLITSLSNKNSIIQYGFL